MLKHNSIRLLLSVALLIMVLFSAFGQAYAVTENDMKLDTREFYDNVPLTLTVNMSTSPTLEKAYAAVTSSRPAYSDITSLKIITEGNATINLTELQGEDVLFLKKLSSLQKIDMSASSMYNTTIPADVFTGMVSLEEVILNESTRTISNYAFKGCTNLHSINLAKITSIKDEAFMGCSSLANVMTTDLTELGENAFRGCTSLAGIDLAKVAVVSGNAFNACYSLKTVGKTEALREVQEYAFAGCRNLEGIDLSKVNNDIGSYAFYDCTNLESIGSAAIVPTVKDHAFYNCTKLKSIDLTVTATLGAYAFYGCTNLEEVKTGVSLRIIPSSAFENCTSLKAIDLKRITTIHNSAFKDCKTLNNLDFTDATSIGINAFYGCSSMDKAAVMPTQSCSIANNAFKYCAFDFSEGYPTNTRFNEHNAPSQRPALVFALADSDAVYYKVGTQIEYDKLYTIKTASGADYAQLIKDQPKWMGATADDIKVTPKIQQDGKDVDAIDVSKEGVYNVTLVLPGTIGSNTNELKLTVTMGTGSGSWREEGGKYYYYEGTTMKTGWVLDSKKWYYLDPQTGAMQTGWAQVGSKWYFMDKNGVMQVGWMEDGGKHYYLKASGEMVVGWEKIGSDWYYFKASGAMETGWLQLGSKWYYLKEDGKMATGSLKVGNKTYNFGADGAMK